MNLQQLRYLVAAVDTGSVSGAARENRVSQPVASRALHSLELRLGVALFRLDGRRLVPTEAGLTVAASARLALDAVGDVERTARRIALGRELVVVATPTNSALLSPIVAAYMRTRPSVSLNLRRAGEMSAVIEMVAAGHADLGFGELPERPANEAVAFQPIWTCDVVLVSPPGSRLPDVVSVADLANLQLVLPPDGNERREMINGLVADAGGRRPVATLATDERSAWISSAQRGLGSFLSYEAVAADLDGVETRSFDPPIKVPVGFVHRTLGLSEEGQGLIARARECELPRGCMAIERPVAV
jgi:DNA-binding transcriptional LysR family regulator